MEEKKKKKRPTFYEYPPDDALQFHIDREISASEMSRLLGLNYQALICHLKRRCLRINRESRVFHSEPAKRIRHEELKKKGYSEKDAITMSMVRGVSGTITTETVIEKTRLISYASFRHGKEKVIQNFRYL